MRLKGTNTPIFLGNSANWKYDHQRKTLIQLPLECGQTALRQRLTALDNLSYALPRVVGPRPKPNHDSCVHTRTSWIVLTRSHFKHTAVSGPLFKRNNLSAAFIQVLTCTMHLQQPRFLPSCMFRVRLRAFLATSSCATAPRNVEVN